MAATQEGTSGDVSKNLRIQVDSLQTMQKYLIEQLKGLRYDHEMLSNRVEAVLAKHEQTMERSRKIAATKRRKREEQLLQDAMAAQSGTSSNDG